MAKRLVKYKLMGDGSIPIWIEEGGMFPEGKDLIGYTVDDEEFYVPSDVVEITEQELKAHLKRAYKNKDGSDRSDRDIDGIVDEIKKKRDRERGKRPGRG